MTRSIPPKMTRSFPLPETFDDPLDSTLLVQKIRKPKKFIEIKGQQLCNTICQHYQSRSRRRSLPTQAHAGVTMVSRRPPVLGGRTINRSVIKCGAFFSIREFQYNKKLNKKSFSKFGHIQIYSLHQLLKKSGQTRGSETFSISKV